LQGCHALKNEPTLISGLVRQSLLGILLPGIGAGLRDRAWAETELRQLESDLAAIRVWDDYRLALDSERGSLNSICETLVTSSRSERAKMATSYGITPNSTPVILVELIPTSVIRDNQLRLNQYLEEMGARIDATHRTLDLDGKTPSSPEFISGSIEQYYYFLARLTGPVYGGIEERYIRVQTLLDEARLACALERFRLKQGAYPATLEELTPGFVAEVPSDIYAHAPYRYERTDAGSFRLYSVGKDRHDDGGQIDPKLSEQRQLDAIWLYAPPPAAP
jgi:hypothetical protein